MLAHETRRQLSVTRDLFMRRKPLRMARRGALRRSPQVVTAVNCSCSNTSRVTNMRGIQRFCRASEPKYCVSCPGECAGEKPEMWDPVLAWRCGLKSPTSEMSDGREAPFGHGQQLWWTFLRPACQLHALSKSVALCCADRTAHFIVASPKHTCAEIRFTSGPKRSVGWVLLEKSSQTKLAQSVRE